MQGPATLDRGHQQSAQGDSKQTRGGLRHVANTCPWAVAFHSTLALKEGVAAEDVGAIREKRAPKDSKVAALSAFSRALIEKRGHVDERDLTTFTSAGFSKDQVLEVIAGLAVSLMANYAGNITNPVVEDAFKPQTWQASEPGPMRSIDH